ncbi:hypothetical protein [Allokutzneria oryzae]|uniref:Uncharacterized protein n=1 Tax=Allokutzneria oryzae TaxID=1378989 RepID=A0ABV5ZPV8_9PSEU
MDREFVTTLARDVVAARAPEELPFFAATSAAYFRDPRRALAGRTRSDEVLGSGLDTAVALLSPVALAVATAVYETLTQKTGELVVERGGRLLGRLGRKLRRKKQEPPLVEAPAELSDEEIGQVRAAVEKRGAALGLSPDQVELLADAVVFSLRRTDGPTTD